MRRNVVAASMTLVALVSGVPALANGPTPQWNLINIASLRDGDFQGAEEVMVIPAAGVPAQTGCIFTDAYIVRDPVVLHSSLALITTAMAMGWGVWMRTDGTCDATGRPLVSQIQVDSVAN